MPVFLPWLAIRQGPMLRHSERFDGRRRASETVFLNSNDPDQRREFQERNDKELVWSPDSRYLLHILCSLRPSVRIARHLKLCEQALSQGRSGSFTGRFHRRGGPEHHSVPARSCPAGRSNLIGDNYFTLKIQQLT